MKKHTQSPSLLYHHGRALEGQKCYTEAAVQYAEILKMDPLHIDAGNRLMIVYRKLKAYRKELAVITKAIEAHRKHIE